MKGENRPGYRAPLTGEKRRTRQPFAIDKLPPEWRDRIKALRGSQLTWEEIEQQSTTWEWDALPQVLILAYFPARRIPHTTLHRWFHLQAIDESVEQRRRLQAWKEALDDRSFTENPESSNRMLAGQLSEVMANGTTSERVEAMKIQFDSDLKLAKLKLDREKLDVEKRAQKLAEDKFEQAKEKLDKSTNEAATKIGKGGKLTIDDINRLRERTFGLPPVQRNTAAGPAA